MSQDEISRRDFLKKAMALAATAAIPSIILGQDKNKAPKEPTFKLPASERVNLACCGCGNRAAEIIDALYATGLCNIVALCDVDMGAEQTLKIMEQFPDAPRYKDFRVMFDKESKNIDAVSIGVPDFSHFPITMLAMSLGKHVYVEKPMARTFEEVQLMMDGAERYGVVTQMGNQGHSEANYFQFKAWTEAGIIKDVTAITAHMNNPRRWHVFDPRMKSMPAAEAVPGTLDWNVWLSQSKWHDYNHDYINGQWRCWYDFGMGALGDWGAHILDTAHQFLDLGLPYEVDPIKLEGHNPFFFPMSSTLAFKFPERNGMPACDITWYDGVNNIPPVPEGYGVSELDPNIPTVAGGKIQPAKLNPGKEIYSKEYIFKGGSHASTLSIISDEPAADREHRMPDVPKSPSNHFANFLLACKKQEQTRSPFSIAGPLCQVFNLGVIAQRTGKKVVFDRRTRQITNSREANALLRPGAVRKEWEEFYKL